MKKFIIGAMMLASISGTANAKRLGADGYHFNKPSFEHLDVQIVMHIMHNQTEFNHAMQEHHVDIPDPRIETHFGFSIISPNNNKCDIWLIDPAVSYHPEELGHEMTHCIYGQWHSDQP